MLQLLIRIIATLPGWDVLSPLPSAAGRKKGNGRGGGGGAGRPSIKGGGNPQEV